MSEQLQRMSKIGLVPLVVLADAACAKPLGEALVAGGIPVAEVTFRTDACLDTIRAMKEIPDLIVGAGTVHTAKQAAAVDAGAHTASACASSSPPPRTAERQHSRRSRGRLPM